MAHRFWDSQIHELCELYAAGFKSLEIGKRLGRSPSSVTNKIAQLKRARDPRLIEACRTSGRELFPELSHGDSFVSRPWGPATKPGRMRIADHLHVLL